MQKEELGSGAPSVGGGSRGVVGFAGRLLRAIMVYKKSSKKVQKKFI